MKCQQLFNNSHHRFYIRENQHTSISISSIDESFWKLELKTYELNKSVNYELAYLIKSRLFSWIFDKLVNCSLQSQQEKSLEEHISPLRKNLCKNDEIIKKLVESQWTILNTISAKSNNQHSNTLASSSSQSSSSLTSNSLN